MLQCFSEGGSLPGVSLKCQWKLYHLHTCFHGHIFSCICFIIKTGLPQPIQPKRGLKRNYWGALGRPAWLWGQTKNVPIRKHCPHSVGVMLNIVPTITMITARPVLSVSQSLYSLGQLDPFYYMERCSLNFAK